MQVNFLYPANARREQRRLGLTALGTSFSASAQRRWSSQARGSHPHLLTEPYVNLSIHTALIVQSMV